MTTPLVRPIVMSVYEVQGARVLMPERMAKCTADMKRAMYGIRDEVQTAGGAFALSDLFRSYDMQFQAHLDYTSGKKKAFSPPPGSSMHEAGRAFDVDLRSLKMSLADFWKVAAKWGVMPIIAEPNPKASEAWHFECRGSHQVVYDYYRGGQGTNFARPAEAMAASAILSAGLPHDRFKGKENEAYIQSGLIRLGKTIGNIDGAIGERTRAALKDLQVADGNPADQAAAIDVQLQQRFPTEFFDWTPDEGEHLIR
jgi:hypothetical protein